MSDGDRFRILFEDNHLLIADKPAGLLVQADRTRDPSLLDYVKQHRKTAEHKPGNVYVGLVHRLDRPVSGIVLFAKSSKAAGRLSEQFRTGVVAKRYLAVVQRGRHFPTVNAGGLWEDWLKKDPARNRVEVLPVPDEAGKATARLARTRWRVLATSARHALFELAPLTGRPHQLRLQTSSRGAPIVGDLKYGSSERFDGQLALHAAALEFEHPTRRERLRFVCPPPASWRRFDFDFEQVCACLREPEP